VLVSLMNITTNPDTAPSGDGFMIETVIAIEDWVMKTMQTEADVVCRALFVRIGQLGLKIIESFK
jgi:hypothetical protein